MDLAFRDADINDLGRIVEIYNSTISSRMVTADTEPITVESRVEWFKKHSPQKRPLWMIENQHHEVVGWVSFQSFYGRPAYDATAELSIYLDANYRGCGIGKQALLHCINKCTDLGVKTLLGFIFAHNDPSLKLFHSLEFQDWGTLPRVALLDGVERDLKILGRRVG